LGIIERRQKARGYFTYVNSEIYRDICRKSNERRAKSDIKIKNTIKDDIKEIKLDIADIKRTIKNLIFASKQVSTNYV